MFLFLAISSSTCRLSHGRNRHAKNDVVIETFVGKFQPRIQSNFKDKNVSIFKGKCDNVTILMQVTGHMLQCRYGLQVRFECSTTTIVSIIV